MGHNVRAVLIGVVAVMSPGQSGSAPLITFIDFPPEILANGQPVVGFNDPDGDIIRAEFTVVEAQDLQLLARLGRSAKSGIRIY
jgi:hypothetical protein